MVRKNSMSIFLILLIWLVCTPVTAHAQDFADQSVKAVVFSDSYGVWPKAYKKWTDYLAEAWGSENGRIIFSVAGGSGFTRIGNKNFMKRLKKMEGSEEVRYILIVGAIRNDRDASTTKLYHKMRAFSSEARLKFPNAKIYYSAPNYDIYSRRMRKILIRRKKYVRKACRKLGWKYLKKSETCLYKKKSNFGSDGHHPSATGQIALSKALIADLKNCGIALKPVSYPSDPYAILSVEPREDADAAAELTALMDAAVRDAA